MRTSLYRARFRIIKAYAAAKGVPMTQDVIRRNLRAAETLLKRFEFSAERVEYLIGCVKSWCEARHLSWTLETVAKVSDHAQKEDRPFKEVTMSGFGGMGDYIKELMQRYGREAR